MVVFGRSPAVVRPLNDRSPPRSAIRLTRTLWPLATKRRAIHLRRAGRRLATHCSHSLVLAATLA